MKGYGWLIALAVLAVLALAGVTVYKKARRALRRFSLDAFGANSLRQGLEEQARHLAATPKSVSAMTRVYLPQIVRDFPEFGWEEFRAKAERTLKGALLAISGQEPSLLTEGSSEMQSQVRLAIEDDRSRGIRHRYEEIKCHRTEIAGYEKRDGACVITLQSAVGHLRWEERNGAVSFGSKDLPVQTKYNMELVYLQDEKKFQSAAVTGAGLTCPNCGAPVPDLGQKQCRYCGMAVAELNLRVWNFTSFRELA